MIDNISYKGTVIRPPSEADSLILQITYGCSDNNCIFCPAYKDKPFETKSLNIIKEEIDFLSNKYPNTRKLFFADGHAIVLDQNTLISIFDHATY